MDADELSIIAREALARICNHVNILEKDHNRHAIDELLHFDLIIVHNGVVSPTSRGISTWLFGMDDVGIAEVRDKLRECADFQSIEHNKVEDTWVNIFTKDDCDDIACDHHKKHLADVEAHMRDKHKDIVSYTLKEFEDNIKKSGGFQYKNFLSRIGKPFNVPVPSRDVRKFTKSEQEILHSLYNEIEIAEATEYKPRVLNRLCKDGYVERFNNRPILMDYGCGNISVGTAIGDYVSLTTKGVAWVMFGDVESVKVFHEDCECNSKSFEWYPTNVILGLL